MGKKKRKSKADGTPTFRCLNHGGKRKGAGRKPKRHAHGSRVEPSHTKRPHFTKSRPLHVTLEMAEDVPNVRAVNLASVVIDAIGRANVRKDFRVVHFCLLGTHIHRICEADGPAELANGMRSVNGTIMHALNERLCREGTVFAHRFLMKLAFEDAPLSFAEPIGRASTRKASRGKKKGPLQRRSTTNTRAREVERVQGVGTPPNQVAPRGQVVM